MVDFSKKQKEIKDYIKNNFSDFLIKNKMTAPAEFIDDVLDLDEHTKNITVFYDFESINFDFQSFETQNQKINFEICFVIRNGKSSELKEKSRDYATAFYNWFYSKECNRNFGGLVDYGTIETVNFYDAVQGTKAIKISNLSLVLNLDD